MKIYIVGFTLLGLFVSKPLLADEETTIQGGTMELVNMGERVLFRGGVVLKSGSDRLEAKQMETSKNRDKVTAKGQVKLFRHLPSGEKLKGFGDSGFFNTQTSEGYLLRGDSQAHVIYQQVLSSTSVRVIDIFADRFDFSEVTSTGVATGHVSGITKDESNGDVYRFWSERAEVNDFEKNIILTGATKSRVIQTLKTGDRTVEGNSITYHFEKRTFLAKGEATAIFMESEVHP